MKYKQGIAPLIVILAIVIVAALGGGVYMTTKSDDAAPNYEAETSEETTSNAPTPEPAKETIVESSAVETPAPVVAKTEAKVTPPSVAKSPSPEPVKPVAVSYKTFDEAYKSGKSLTCVGSLEGGKGPAEPATSYFAPGKVRTDHKYGAYLLLENKLYFWYNSTPKGGSKVYDNVDTSVVFYGFSVESCQEGPVAADKFTLPTDKTF